MILFVALMPQGLIGLARRFKRSPETRHAH
jgi:hypothetical protein